MAPSESERRRASERAREREKKRYSFDDIDPVVFAKTFVTDCVRFLVTRRARRRPMRLHVTKDTGADTRNRTLAPNRGRRYVYIYSKLASWQACHFWLSSTPKLSVYCARKTARRFLSRWLLSRCDSSLSTTRSKLRFRVWFARFVIRSHFEIVSSPNRSYNSLAG